MFVVEQILLAISMLSGSENLFLSPVIDRGFSTSDLEPPKKCGRKLNYSDRRGVNSFFRGIDWAVLFERFTVDLDKTGHV